MKPIRTAFLGISAAALIGAAGLAFAQTPPGPAGGAPGGPTGGPAGGPGQQMEQRGQHPMMERMHDRYEHWRHGEMGMRGPMGHVCDTKDDVSKPIIDRLERAIQPKDTQKADVDALRAAASKAQDTLRAACPTEAERGDRTPPARLAMAEKHATAMAEALHTVRPPFDALYAKLDDKQRDRLRWMGPMFGPGRQ